MKKNKTVRHTFRLTENQNRKFNELLSYCQCETNKSRFIIHRIFDLPLKVIKVDSGSMKYYARLNSLIAQITR